MLREAFTPAIEQIIGTPACHVGKSVSFLHPGYSSGDNVLLRLPAADGEHGGIDYDLALHACAILACNRFDGYFTDANATPEDRIKVLPKGGILSPGEYFFRVPTSTDANEPYAVGASFYDWEFPHETLPSCWRSQGMARAMTVSNLRAPAAGLAERDHFCRVSGSQEMVQQAHVVPESEWMWFVSNGMRRYAVQGVRHGVELMSNIENKLLLRSDLHTLWDSRAFVFVPKGGSHDDIVTHVLQESVELLAVYHNRLTHPLYARREFLFARLAWAIFPFMRSFLDANQRRKVAIRKETGNTEIQTLSAEQCAAIVLQRKRSNSPKKRKASETASGAVGTDSFQTAVELHYCLESPRADSGYSAVDDDDLLSTDGTMRRLKRRASEGDDDLYEHHTNLDRREEDLRGRKR